jgi:predicted metal-dependent enzyme (double-stranded beta helix superfamily)
MMNRRFENFIDAMGGLLGRGPDEPTLLREGRILLADLVHHDDWLPARAGAARGDRYAQHLLHRDPQGRFSVVSFVWGPGQCTPVHDHMTWGLVGVMRGAERCEECTLQDGLPRLSGAAHLMQPGDVEAVSPTLGDWHRVSSARDDGLSISIHVYGADIGQVQRHRLDDAGTLIAFVSGYDSEPAC